jgi:hypothetical protein
MTPRPGSLTSAPSSRSARACFRRGAQTLGPDMIAGEFVRQYHGRRAAARRPYLLCAGRMAACCLGAGPLGDNVESEIQGLHTEALQCAGYYGSRTLTPRNRLAVPRRGDPLSACPAARGEPTPGGGCRAWAPTDQ